MEVSELRVPILKMGLELIRIRTNIYEVPGTWYVQNKQM